MNFNKRMAFTDKNVWNRLPLTNEQKHQVLENMRTDTTPPTPNPASFTEDKEIPSVIGEQEEMPSKPPVLRRTDTRSFLPPSRLDTVEEETETERSEKRAVMLE